MVKRSAVIMIRDRIVRWFFIKYPEKEALKCWLAIVKREHGTNYFTLDLNLVAGLISLYHLYPMEIKVLLLYDKEEIINLSFKNRQ